MQIKSFEGGQKSVFIFLAIPIITIFNLNTDRQRSYQRKLEGDGWEPGLVVMVGDSFSRGCDFESSQQILVGQFFI